MSARPAIAYLAPARFWTTMAHFRVQHAFAWSDHQARMDRYALIDTAWGIMAIMGDSEDGIHAVLPPHPLPINQLRSQLRDQFPGLREQPHLAPCLQESLLDYFLRRSCRLKGVVVWAGHSTFARRVMQACSRIPCDGTATYQSLAVQVDHPRAARAVGRVMAANPLPILVPCHRVLRSDGSLGGYSATGGTDYKRRLLQHEGIVANDSSVTT